MVKRIRWIERKFNFDAPPGMFPVFVERLRGTLPRLKDTTAQFTEEKLEQRVNNGWSIKEHIGHLIDLEELHSNRVDQLMTSVSILQPADMTNKKTYLADHNDSSLKSLLDTFEKTRNDFISKLKDFDEFDAIRSATHPRLGKPMRMIDLVFFAAEHDDHHLTVIREIAETINK